ncbi:MAG: helix-hairpin-helix domain-containing protein [Candidatus Limnocylindrales bacterium]
MTPTAPDWRVIGTAPAVDGGEPAPEPRRVVVSTRQLAWGTAAVVALIVIGAVAALLAMPGTGGVIIDATVTDGSWSGRAAALTPPGVASAVDRPTDIAGRQLLVDVEGAVARPGLVSVPASGRVGDAIELAGGFAANADLAAAAGALNLAQAATDGLKVVVPAMGDATQARAGAGSPSDASGGPIDLNRATEAELDSLPGVGPATIAKIVAAREEAPFATIDELRSRGIVGEATFGKLRDLVAVAR